MSFRGIDGTSAAVDAIMLLRDTAKGLPRCERLGGRTSRTDGGPVRTCPCVIATSPDANCPHRTTRMAPKVTLIAASTFATYIDESDPVIMTAIGPANVALIRVIRDNEIKIFTRGEIDLLSAVARGL